MNFVSLLGNENVPREHPWLSFSFFLPDGTPCFFKPTSPRVHSLISSTLPTSSTPKNVAQCYLYWRQREYFLFSDPSGFVIPEHLRTRYDKPVTEQDCVCICDHIVDWKMLLRHLKVSEGIIRNVDEDYRRTNEKSYQGLLEWKRTRAHEATIRNLCTALWSVRYTEALEKLSSQGMIWKRMFGYKMSYKLT